jgi:hypothetical protein
MPARRPRLLPRQVRCYRLFCKTSHRCGNWATRRFVFCADNNPAPQEAFLCVNHAPEHVDLYGNRKQRARIGPDRVCNSAQRARLLARRRQLAFLFKCINLPREVGARIVAFSEESQACDELFRPDIVCRKTARAAPHAPCSLCRCLRPRGGYKHNDLCNPCTASLWKPDVVEI